MRVSAVWVSPMQADGSRVPGEPLALRCDCLLISGGWNPTVHLFSQSRGKLRFDAGRRGLRAGPLGPARALGRCRQRQLRPRGVPGRRCPTPARQLPRGAGFTGQPHPAPVGRANRRRSRSAADLGGARSRRAGRAKAFVDFQNDVTADDLGLAVREGFRSVEHVKRYTTTGMGTDQGKTSNVNALAIVADKRGIPIEVVAPPPSACPTRRSPSARSPARMAASCSTRSAARRCHAWAEGAGAVFEDVGHWKRARYFPRPGEDMHDAVQRECLAVRQGVGLFDACTLGKIDIQGPDSAELLNRVYTNAWTKLEIGRCRYGLMLREDGMVFDDGVTARLGPATST